MPQGRKHKAFNAPKSAAVKAIMAQNADSSPLLRLPAEVKSMIFSYALGQHDIHIGYSPNRAKFKVRVQGKDTKTGLDILRTSRQVYAEAHPWFWSTNKFMFSDSTAFRLWMKGRTTHEKQLIRRVQLFMDIENRSEKGKKRQNWNLALCNGVVASLSGLTDLRLRIRQHLYANDHGYAWHIKVEDMIPGALLGAERFARLPLKDVHVSIVNFCKRGNGSFPLSMWETTQKCDMKKEAKRLKKKLLKNTPATAE